MSDLPTTSLRTFKALDIDGSSTATFEIKFIQPKHYDEAINIMNEFFLADEPMARVRKFKEDREAMIENTAAWLGILSDKKASIACFKRVKDDEEMVAANFLYVKRKAVNDDCEIKAKNFRDIINAMKFAEMQCDVFELYRVDAYLAAMGLGVNLAYRGRGIATEMLKARQEVMKILNLRLTSTQFTGEGSQKAAMRAGFEENFCVTYEEIFKADNELFFPGIDAKAIKTMSLAVEK